MVDLFREWAFQVKTKREGNEKKMIPEHIWKSGVAERFGVKRWLVFLALVDLPGEIDVDEERKLIGVKEVSVSELVLMTGLKAEEVRKALKWMQNQEVISYYEPESDEEEMLVRIWGIADFIEDLEGFRKRYKEYLKYVDGDEREEARSPVDVVMDMYLGLLGGSYRSDPLSVIKLEGLAYRFALVDIKEGFEEAKKKGIKNIDSIWLLCEEKERRRKGARGDGRKR